MCSYNTQHWCLFFLLSSCVLTTSLTRWRVSTRSPATVELLNAGSGLTEENDKPTGIPKCYSVLMLWSLHRGKCLTLKSFYEWAKGLNPWKRQIYVLVHQDHVNKNGWSKQQCNTVAGCDLCHMWGALLYVMPLSVCICVSWYTRGAESTSEWESTVQGAALLLIKGRPFVSYC